jgi:hypothetical protein
MRSNLLSAVTLEVFLLPDTIDYKSLACLLWFWCRGIRDSLSAEVVVKLAVLNLIVLQYLG